MLVDGVVHVLEQRHDLAQQRRGGALPAVRLLARARRRALRVAQAVQSGAGVMFYFYVGYTIMYVFPGQSYFGVFQLYLFST